MIGNVWLVTVSASCYMHQCSVHYRRNKELYWKWTEITARAISSHRSGMPRAMRAREGHSPRLVGRVDVSRCFRIFRKKYLTSRWNSFKMRKKDLTGQNISWKVYLRSIGSDRVLTLTWPVVAAYTQELCAFYWILRNDYNKWPSYSFHLIWENKN